MEHITRQLVTAALAALVAGCNGAVPVDTGLCAGLVSELVVRDESGQARYTYAAGETMRFEMQIVNTGAIPIVLHATDGCPPVEFIIDNAQGQTVWGSNDGVMCAAVVREVTYPAAQSQTFTAEWHQVQRDGAHTGSATYTVYATERTECGMLLSKSAEITIESSIPKQLAVQNGSEFQEVN
jgi:hypothetical protein